MSKQKLSHSSVRTFTECARKYDFHYNKRLRGRNIHGALLYGSSIDLALNHLVETKDLNESIKIFDKSFNNQFINGVSTYLPLATNVVYSVKDFDVDLLKEEDYQHYEKVQLEFGKMGSQYSDPDVELKKLVELKKQGGFGKFTKQQKQIYNLINWLSLRRKGHVMLQSYATKVLPRIKRVIAVQKKSELVNDQGDSVVYIIDLIVEWEDGKIYLMDNKTSSIDYEEDSAMKSQQLVLYYHAEKEESKLDGVGFIVLNKNILKNRVKICSICGYDGSGARHKTCSEMVTFKEMNSNKVEVIRCNGGWKETVSPECFIKVIINKVPPATEDLVLETFDSVNTAIKTGNFPPNLNACGNTNFQCTYYNKCHFGSDEDLIDMKEKK